MSKYYYKTRIDSKTGKRISRFWERCQMAEKAQLEYLRKMGATDVCLEPAEYFAGGVAAVSFAEGKKVDETVWRKASVDADGTQFWQPRCEWRKGEIEIPSRDYEVRDTALRMYVREAVTERSVPNPGYQEGGTEPKTVSRLFLPYLEFYRDEPAGHSGRTGNPRQASRGLRKAARAETLRRRLPVVLPDELLLALKPAASGRIRETPAFFIFQGRYYVCIAADCSANADLEAIPMQEYNLNKGRALLKAKRGWS